MKTYTVAVGNIEYSVSMRRLPMRTQDNNTRHRVRLTTRVLNGEIIRSAHRDVDQSKAHRIFDQNVARLADKISA